MTDVATFLSRQLKRSRNEVNAWGSSATIPAQENQVLLHKLLQEAVKDETIHAAVVPYLVPEKDGTHSVGAQHVEPILVMLLKKELKGRYPKHEWR